MRMHRIGKHLTFGDTFLDKHQPSLAKRNYGSAIVLDQQNKAAHIGFTKACILDCIKNFHSCDEAERRLKKLQAFDKISSSEWNELTALWESEDNRYFKFLEAEKAEN